MTKVDDLLSNPDKLWRIGASLLRSGKAGWKQYIEFTFKDERGKRVIFADHQKVIFDFIDRKFNHDGYDRIAIETPWGHGKTQSISLFYTLWQIGLNPRIRIKVISAKDSVASVRVSANRLSIEENRDYQMIFPHIKRGDKWGEQVFRVKGSSLGSTDYTMEGYGVGSARMGGRADLMIFDDVCDLDNSLTEDQRIKTRNKIDYQWLSRVSPQGKVISIGTPWHREDAIQQITKKWQRLQIKVSDNIDCLEVWENGDLVDRVSLWEAQWDAEKITAIRQDNYKRFNMGYRLIPASDEDATFKHVDKAIQWNTNPLDYEYVGIWGGVDLSTKTRPGTVAELAGITPDGKRVLIDIHYLDDPVNLKSLFMQWRNDWGGKFNYANVENNALQDVIVDMLKGVDIIPIRGFLTGKNKHDPYHGIPVLDTEFENGRLVIPVPHDSETYDNCPRCRLIRALKLHPFGTETDSIMALWFVRSAMMNYSRKVFA